jgi:hypothetical protein
MCTFYSTHFRTKYLIKMTQFAYCNGERSVTDIAKLVKRFWGTVVCKYSVNRNLNLSLRGFRRVKSLVCCAMLT